MQHGDCKKKKQIHYYHKVPKGLARAQAYLLRHKRHYHTSQNGTALSERFPAELQHALAAYLTKEDADKLARLSARHREVFRGKCWARVAVYEDAERCLAVQSRDPRVRVISEKVFENPGRHAWLPWEEIECVDYYLARNTGRDDALDSDEEAKRARSQPPADPGQVHKPPLEILLERLPEYREMYPRLRLMRVYAPPDLDRGPASGGW